ncbi:hypothetical protein L3Q82_026735 [Scortum barcoo]|uniref:Uncharacterized protein n=1 Tax=Scortum barcoo TaxID=214431 RepID=A0ACB8WJ77_9TELE|nr:hypothetical protein L3Q82_026735 [Scortum barcoo]
MCTDLRNPPENLWELMCSAGQFKSLMGCGTPQGETSANTVMPNGLVQGHAYTVTGVRQMMSQGKPVHLVRLWNPWGKGEWNGDWSDRSPLWKTVSAQDREMCLSVSDDGEFWMTLEDLCKFYCDLDICCLCPDFLDGNSSSHWKTSFYEGRWVAGTTAGGCMNNRALVNEELTYHLLLQYKMQTGKFPASFFSSHAPVAQTKTYMNAREVMEFVMLKPGEYLIVPSTFNPNETASFILTIHSKAETRGYENSGHYQPEPVEKLAKATNVQDDEKRKKIFRQFSDKYEEVDAEQLQGLLNENILKGDLKSGGFSIDACRSMVALMDTSITGKLNSEEFVRLWKKVVSYKDIFFLTDVSRTGTLSLSELRNALVASGINVSDDMLNLMALRYGASSGHMTLESFIGLILRLECMYKIFKQLSDGKAMTLRESEVIKHFFFLIMEKTTSTVTTSQRDVCGSYSYMNTGTPAEALVDFTGGVHMCIELSNPPPDLWDLMCRAVVAWGASLTSTTTQSLDQNMCWSPVNRSTEYPAFLESLGGVLDSAPTGDSIVLLGDFNAHVGNTFCYWTSVLVTVCP